MRYSVFDKPLRVYGVPHFDRTHRLERLPSELRERLDLPDTCDMVHLGSRTMGGRVGFRTDAKRITVGAKLETLAPDPGMGRYACSSLAVYFGKGESWRFAGLVCPGSWEDMTPSKCFEHDGGMEDIMIYMPRNEVISDLWIEVEGGAAVCEPTGYKYGDKPMVFFGSSITEGGHAAVVTNAYSELLSRWADADYYNLGFSGSCHGQLELADFISGLNPGVLFYDYDHNAPTADYLEATHEPFFRRVRELMPELPVIMMTAPNYAHMPEADRRRGIIRRTFENALAAGDKKVWFVDGKEYFTGRDAHVCTTDTVHPNDFGFHLMAEKIFPVLKEALGL